MRNVTRFFIFLVTALTVSCAVSGEGFGEKSRDAANETALMTARNNIEKFRKGDVRIKVTDAKGKPIAAAQLKIKQVSHDFKFGCYLKIDDLAADKLPEYERQFKHLFNFAVVGTFWDFIETTRGRENWQWFERETALKNVKGGVFVLARRPHTFVISRRT